MNSRDKNWKRVLLPVRWIRKFVGSAQDESGFGLVESLVAVALLGTAVITLISTLSTGSLAVSATRDGVVTQALGQSQIAYTKSYPFVSGTNSYPNVGIFDATYNPHPIAVPSGFSIMVTATPTQDNSSSIQRIKAIVSKNGVPILTLEDFKVNR